MNDYDSLKKVSRGKFSYSKFLKLKEIATNTVGLDNEIYPLQLNSMLSLIDTMDKHISLIENKIYEIVDFLKPRCLSIKGIGTILSASIVAEFGDFNRFKSAHRVALSHVAKKLVRVIYKLETSNEAFDSSKLK